jgi:hypothetical protein
MTTPALASRVMKARRETQCPACRAWILVGDLIARTTLGWLHAGCAIARMHEAKTITEGTRP